MELPLIKLTVTVTKGLSGLLITVCTFFMTLFAARSYSEWHLWRLKHQAPLVELKGMNEQISAAQVAITSRRLERLKKLSALLDNGTAFTTRKEEYQQLDDEAKADQQGSEWQQLLAMQETLLELLVPVRRSVLFRFWLEAVFPVAFGAIAIVWAAFTP